ncbi:hypothetical protein BJV78DRAFT_1286395 [Lactifluus subvellereus]|nr:hypothetical protein BJV78DRAFT_1286395 [Lactifluus subvellereus]
MSSVDTQLERRRNVHVFGSLAKQYKEVAGFWQHGRVTIAAFYSWLDEVPFVRPEGWALYPADGPLLPRDGGFAHPGPSGPFLQPDDEGVLDPGNYILLAPDGKICRVAVDPELPHRRAYSTNRTYTPHAGGLRPGLAGEVVPQDANFVGFEAAHIFPLSEADGFHDRGYDSFITDPLVDYKGKINSVQQGLLATSVWHRRFDDYQIGINPDDGYRITDFRRREGPSPVDGRVFYIDRNCPDEFRPSAELLRDHLGQCVLANLKVAGDWSVPRFDPELHLGPGGFDLSGGWWTTDEGRAQLDAQLRATLNPWGVELQRTARFDHTEA